MTEAFMLEGGMVREAPFEKWIDAVRNDAKMLLDSMFGQDFEDDSHFIEFLSDFLDENWRPNMNVDGEIVAISDDLWKDYRDRVIQELKEAKNERNLSTNRRV